MTTVEIYKHARENLARIAHEQGVQLAANLNTSSEVNYRCRLINIDEYYVFGASQLFGFIAGILASDHDVSDLFIDSALRICDNDVDKFERLVNDIDELADRYKVNVIMTSSLPLESATDGLKKFI